MKIVTTQERAQSAAMRIYHQYMTLPENRMPRITPREWEVKHAKVKALNPPTPQAVTEIMGVSHWTDIQCSACGLMVDAAAEFEASTWPILICHTCLIENANAIAMEIVK
jgi:hypothetical protein